VNKEIVIVMGYNAAGKTTLTEELVNDGYARFNRDTIGGKLAEVAKQAEIALKNGEDKVVLDNTYGTVEQRAGVIAVGKRLGIPVRCIHLNTSLADAQMNACLRMMDRIGRIADTAELSKINDPNLFPPAAIFAYKNRFEKPTKTEGFSEIEVVKFVRKNPSHWINKALLLDYDDTLRRSTGPKKWPEDPSHVEILPNRKEVLAKYEDDGYLLLGVSNQSAIAKGLDEDIAIDCFERTNELLGFDIEYKYCPHSVPPVKCYCRKPQVGNGAYFIWKYHLDPSQCIMVGDQTSDKTFATRCGFQYKDEAEFFA